MSETLVLKDVTFDSFVQIFLLFEWKLYYEFEKQDQNFREGNFSFLSFLFHRPWTSWPTLNPDTCFQIINFKSNKQYVKKLILTGTLKHLSYNRSIEIEQFQLNRNF